MPSKPVEQIVNVLKSFLPEGLYALDFSLVHYNKLLDILKISEERKYFDLKRDVLIEGIIEYFKLSAQMVSVNLSFRNCEITKQFMNEMESEEFDRNIHNNTVFLMEIATRHDEFKILPNLLVLPEEIRNNLFQIFTDNEIPIEIARKIIRHQIQPVFELNDRDVIFFLRTRVWIRYHVQQVKVDGRDTRFAGESPEVLEAMYNTYFPNDIWGDIEPILNEILEEKLNFSVIDNAYFRKTFIPVYRGMIEILLVDRLTPNDHEKIEGFTGYVLRQYFDNILLYTAKSLLDYVENRDKNAEIFIKNFTDTVVIDSNGTKIQKYPIIDDKQQKWNYASILSVLMQYKQAKLKIMLQNKNIQTAREKVTVCEIDIKSDNNNQLDQEQSLAVIQKQIADSDFTCFSSKKDGHPSLISSLSKQHEELLSARKIEENTLNIIKNRIINKIIELKRRRQRVILEINAHEMLIEQLTPIMETYEGIAHGVAVALTKR